MNFEIVLARSSYITMLVVGQCKLHSFVTRQWGMSKVMNVYVHFDVGRPPVE